MMRELKVFVITRKLVGICNAAAQIPMMRELKVFLRLPCRTHDDAAAQIPMMRELKGANFQLSTIVD